MSTSPTNHNIALKRATIENVDEILKIEKSVMGKNTYTGLVSKEEVVKETADSVFYLIEQGARVVGDASYEVKDENHVYISGLVVTPEFQGKGIGKKAMQIILEELKRIKVIDLVVHPENEKAVELYKSLGLKKSGEVLENYYGDGEPRIRMVLEKQDEN